MKCASIDIGTNTVLMLIVEIENELKEILDVSRITGLGKGLRDKGFLSDDAMERTFNALKTYKRLIDHYHVNEILCVGTNALREAKNSPYFIHIVEKLLNIQVRVISEREEAFYTYLSAKHDGFIQDEGAFIVDIGGGSTEGIQAERDRFIDYVSLPVGSVKLTEMFIKSDPPTDEELTCLSEYVRRLLNIPFAHREHMLIGTGGTITNVASIYLGLESFDKGKVHGLKIPLNEIKRQIDKMKGMDLLQKKMVVGMEKGREDVILQGITLLKEIMVYLNVNEINVNVHGVRYGVIYERYGKNKDS